MSSIFTKGLDFCFEQTRLIQILARAEFLGHVIFKRKGKCSPSSISFQLGQKHNRPGLGSKTLSLRTSRTLECPVYGGKHNSAVFWIHYQRTSVLWAPRLQRFSCVKETGQSEPVRLWLLVQDFCGRDVRTDSPLLPLVVQSPPRPSAPAPHLLPFFRGGVQQRHYRIAGLCKESEDG